MGGGDADTQTITDGHSPCEGNKEPPTWDERGGSGPRSHDLGTRAPEHSEGSSLFSEALPWASHAQRDSWPEREGARPPCFQPRPPPAGARHGPGPAPGHPCAVLPPSSRSETQEEPRPSSAQNPQQSPPRPEKRHGHGDIHSTLLVTASTWGQPRAHRQEGGQTMTHLSRQGHHLATDKERTSHTPRNADESPVTYTKRKRQATRTEDRVPHARHARGSRTGTCSARGSRGSHTGAEGTFRGSEGTVTHTTYDPGQCVLLFVNSTSVSGKETGNEE